VTHDDPVVPAVAANGILFGDGAKPPFGPFVFSRLTSALGPDVAGSPMTKEMPPSSKPMASTSLFRMRLGANAIDVTAQGKAGMESSAVADDEFVWSTRHTFTRLSRPHVANTSFAGKVGAH
jgi:hypothetical protein